MKGFEKLLSPIEIAPNFVLKNRMIKAPQSSWRWNEDCTADGSDAIAMYENMAEGGVAAIDVAAILWEPAGGIYLGAYDDRFIPGIDTKIPAVIGSVKSAPFSLAKYSRIFPTVITLP